MSNFCSRGTPPREVLVNENPLSQPTLSLSPGARSGTHLTKTDFMIQDFQRRILLCKCRGLQVRPSGERNNQSTFMVKPCSQNGILVKICNQNSTFGPRVCCLSAGVQAPGTSIWKTDSVIVRGQSTHPCVVKARTQNTS